MDENQITKFLQEQTEKIKPLYKNLGHSYWDASTTGKKEAYEKYENCLKEMAKFFNDSKNFEKIKEFLGLNPQDIIIKRQLIALYNSYLMNQGDIDLINEILKKSTTIEEKFNKFRAVIDNKEMTDNNIKDILTQETDSGKLQEAWEASKKQGELVEKELIELIKLRNQLAKSLGFDNYYLLSLKANEQSEEEIIEIFNRLDELTGQVFTETKKEIDSFLSKRYNTSDLKPWHYQDLFFQEAPEVYNIDFDKFYKEDILEIAKKFYSSIGIDVSKIILDSDLYEKPGKYQHAYCIDLDREGDIRSLMNIKNNEKWMDTVLHELGHGIYWQNIDKKLPFLIRETSHTLTTEAIAQLFGRQSKNISFIKEFCDISSEEIEKIADDAQKSLRLKELVFSRWSQVMFNFEKSMYKDPTQDLNKLWWELVKKYQLIDFSRDRPDWASKIHFVSSPVYYHNYLIGELFASQINNHIIEILNEKSLKNPNYSGKKEIGEYLKSKIFFPGAIYNWDELIKYSTGEKLNPKYWIEEFG